MNCLKFRQQASFYIDRQLDSAANQEFLFHLNSCLDCFEYVDEIRKTANLLKQLGQALPPNNLASEIITAIDNTRRPRSRELMVWFRNLTIESKPHYLAYASSFVITC